MKFPALTSLTKVLAPLLAAGFCASALADVNYMSSRFRRRERS